MAVELTIHGVGQAPGSSTPVVVLREKDGPRYLIIAVGPLELTAIAVALGDVPPPRPLTHDLLMAALGAAGARVTHAVIHAVIDGVFHARLVLDVQGRHAELDARSSDAVAVALRAGIPVHVEEAVLQRAGVTEQGRDAKDAKEERIGEDQLGVFRDAVEGLNLDDLGQPGSAG